MKAGENIAIKVPSDTWDSTVRFYRETVGLEEVATANPASRAFRFGAMTLWIDHCAHLSQSEVWLELACDSLETAARALSVPGIVRRDDIEPLPEGMRAFWIKAPSGVVHLVSETEK